MIDLKTYWQRKRWATCATIDRSGDIWLWEQRPTPNPQLGIWDAPAGRRFYVRQGDPPESWLVAIWDRPEGI